MNGQCGLCWRYFPPEFLWRGCECLMPGCEGDSGDECGEILLCSECV